jgi:hypothetical protein
MKVIWLLVIQSFAKSWSILRESLELVEDWLTEFILFIYTHYLQLATIYLVIGILYMLAANRGDL